MEERGVTTVRLFVRRYVPNPSPNSHDLHSGRFFLRGRAGTKRGTGRHRYFKIAVFFVGCGELGRGAGLGGWEGNSLGLAVRGKS